MQVAKLEVDYNEARRQHQKYLKHTHMETPADAEIRRAYHHIARGTMIIQAMKSIATAGVDRRGLPRLAICRADSKHVWVDMFANGAAKFRDRMSDYPGRKDIRRHELAPATFPRRLSDISGRAEMPLIPIDLRPKRALNNYHILFEAEWGPVPPGDPYLLERIGKADLWIVHAVWDLTEVEKAAMATRIVGAS